MIINNLIIEGVLARHDTVIKLYRSHHKLKIWHGLNLPSIYMVKIVVQSKQTIKSMYIQDYKTNFTTGKHEKKNQG